MPNKCAGCGRVYDNYAVELIKGCECGSSVFIYKRVTTADGRMLGTQEKETKKTVAVPLGAAPGPAAFEVDAKEVVKKVQGALQRLQEVSAESRDEKDADVVFDLEAIRIIEEGVYDINVSKLVQKEPLIVEIKEDGKYFVHLASIFKRVLEIEDEALELKKR